MNFEALIEFFDMGGVAMIHAMAKNYKNVADVADTP
jgi:AICAR transformylase/IMP cyclohydrolase PurH